MRGRTAHDFRVMWRNGRAKIAPPPHTHTLGLVKIIRMTPSYSCIQRELHMGTAWVVTSIHMQVLILFAEPKLNSYHRNGMQRNQSCSYGAVWCSAWDRASIPACRDW
jgi:hypothetical protein